MDIAKKIHSEYKKVWDSLPSGKGNLRFGRKLVSISSIAQQYYCEKTLELNFVNPSPLSTHRIDANGKRGAR